LLVRETLVSQWLQYRLGINIYVRQYTLAINIYAGFLIFFVCPPAVY